MAVRKPETKKEVKEKEVVIEAEVVEEAPVKERVFNDTDLIPCISVIAGELLWEGDKSGNIYKWGDIDSVEKVEYRDLYRAIQGEYKYITAPRFIVDDEDMRKKFPILEEAFAKMYDSKELKSYLKLDASDLKKKLESLPDTAAKSFKFIAANEIEKGRFDSANKIKVIDEFFGTNLMLTLK